MGNCPVPNTQYPIPNTQSPVPNTQYPAPNSVTLRFTFSIIVMRPILAAIVLLAISITASAQWRYKFVPGEKLNYAVVSNTEVNTSQGGQDMTMQNDANQSVEITVEKVEGDNVTLVTTPTSIKMHMNAPMMGDTSLELKDLEGKRTRHWLTNAGKMLHSPELLDTGKIGDPMVAEMARGLRSSMNVLHELPAGVVAKGGAWSLTKTDTQDVQQGKVFSTTLIKGTYARDCDTLGHKCAVLNYTVGITMEGNMKIQNMFDAAISGEGSGKGTVYFDVARGRMLTNISNVELNQQIAITGQQSMVIPQTMTTTTKISLVE
jgi:hypothetical protein